MAGVLTLLHEQALTGQTAFTITHNLSRSGLVLQVIENGIAHPERIVDTTPNAVDPLNQLDVTLNVPTTGRVQVFGTTGNFAQLPSVAQAVHLAKSSVYGSERFYAEQTKPNTHTSESLQTALSLSATVEGGTYRLDWYYEWALDDTSRSFVAEVRSDGTVVGDQTQEPKDSSGRSSPGSRSGTDQRHNVHGFWEGDMVAGTRVLDIRFSTENNDKSATIYRSRLSLLRIA